MSTIGDCNEDEIWDGSNLRCIKEDWRHMIGDGHLPNRYWVMYSNDEYICKPDEDGHILCDGDESIESKGGVIAVFDGFYDAIDFATNFRDMEETLTIRGEVLSVTNKVVEDRLVGQVWEEATHTYRYTTEVEVDERNTEVHSEERYLRDRMNELDAIFW